MARRRRHRRAYGCRPEIHLAYGARARPLGRAILKLLPPAPPPGTPFPTCRGAATGCLSCRRWAHLLHADDPVAYRRLVTRAVCAIQQAPDAPPPLRYTPGNAGHSQAQLVRETTKWILTDRSCKTTSVLCNGIREGGLGKHASNLVSSSSWDILLHRCYAWRNAQMAHNICGGNPISSSKAGFDSSENTQKVDALPSSGSCDAVGVIKPKCSGDGCNCSNSFTQKPRKRKRLCSWQRRSKQKQVCYEDRSIELSKLNMSNQAAEVENQRHSLHPTADNTFLGGNNGNNFPQIEEPGNVPVLSSQKSLSSVLYIMPSQGLSCGYNTPGDQSTRPQVGLSS